MRKRSHAVSSEDGDRRRGRLRAIDLLGDRGGKVCRDFILHREQFANVAIVAAGPELLAVLGDDQFGRDADLVARATHRASDQICRVDLARDQARADAFALEGEGRVPAQHAIERLQRQREDQIFRQAIGKILVRAAAEIIEGKHADNRGSVLRGQVRTVP